MSDISAAEQMAINEALTDKTDIVWRLRANWSYLGREAADEITRLRAQLEQAAAEIARLRLTDAEREAVGRQARSLERDAERSGMIGLQEMLVQEAATLRGLLERMA